jgi:hypothetical protein
LAKVDSKLRSDTTKKSLCDALDASGIEKHIGNTWNKRVVSKSNHLRFDFLILQKCDEELQQVEDFVNAEFRRIAINRT